MIKVDWDVEELVALIDIYLREQRGEVSDLGAELEGLVRGSVEETLNELLEQEAEKLTQAARYERSEARQGYRYGVWRTLPRRCGAARCPRQRSAS